MNLKPTLLLAEDIAMDSEQKKRSEALKAYAGALARKLGGSIDLVHVEDLADYPVRVPQYRSLFDRYFGEKKAKLQTRAKGFPVPTSARFLSGAPVKKLLSLAAKRGAYEMMVVGTHGRKGLSRLVLGSVAEEVIRQARIPVMTVGPKTHDSAARFLEGANTTILIPTGLTPNTAKAEEYGMKLARRTGASVVFFHSMREALHPVLQTAFSSPTPPPQLRDFYDKLKTSSVNQLEKRVQKAKRKGISASYSLDEKCFSSSEAVLKEIARSAASLVIMGTHGRSMVSGAFFGRTARDVILQSPVPVVTVHSHQA